MNVVPRLKTVSKVAESVKFIDANPQIENKPVKVEADKSAEVESDSEYEDVISKNYFRNNFLLVIIFASIIIILIIVIVWLVCRNDKYLSWIRGGGVPPAPPKKVSAHKSLVNDASAEEIAKFANLGNKPDVVIDIKPEPEVPAVEETKIDISLDVDESIKSSIDNHLSALASQDDTSHSAINQAIDAEVAQMDTVQNRAIEKIHISTGRVTRTFLNSESIISSSLDLDKVLQCCRGELDTYNNAKWRFEPGTDGDVVPPPE